MSIRRTWRSLSDVSEPVLWFVGSFLALDDQMSLALTCKRLLAAMRVCGKDLDTVSATQRMTISELCLALCVLNQPLRSLVIAPTHPYWHRSDALRRLLLRLCKQLISLRVERNSIHEMRLCALYSDWNNEMSKWFTRALNDEVIGSDKLQILQMPMPSTNMHLLFHAPSLRQANVSIGPLLNARCLEKPSPYLATLTVDRHLIGEWQMSEANGYRGVPSSHRYSQGQMFNDILDNVSDIFKRYPKAFAQITSLELTNCFFARRSLRECLLTTAAHCPALSRLEIHFCKFFIKEKTKEEKRYAELKKALKPLAPLRAVHITHASVSLLTLKCLSDCAHSTLESLQLRQCSVPTLYVAWKPFFDKCTRLKTLAITEPFEKIRSHFRKHYEYNVFNRLVFTMLVTAVRRPLASGRKHYCNLRKVLLLAISAPKLEGDDASVVVDVGIEEGDEKQGIDESRIDLTVEHASAECGTKQKMSLFRTFARKYEVTHDSQGTEYVTVFGDFLIDEMRKALSGVCFRPAADWRICPKGCAQKVRLEAMADHLSLVCSHTLVKCPLGCGQTYARSVTAEHLRVCAKYEIKCPICYQFVAGGMEAYEAHRGYCKSMPQEIFEQLEFEGEHKVEGKDMGFAAAKVWICGECKQRNLWRQKACCGVRPKVVRQGDSDILMPMRQWTPGFVRLPKGSYTPTFCGRSRPSS